ncbi:hypothetical protein [Rhizobium wenxiniae]|uniref:hypothetical protein n=1 Tax=Rhizobium wenxiniae TaxID=1737357 RepID=UPI003C18638E
MHSGIEQQILQVRDGAESLPEFADIELLLPQRRRSKPDELLDEALMETFPASDPMASGRMD